MQKHFALAVLALSLALTGCGKQGGDSEKKGKEKPPPETVKVTQPAEKPPAEAPAPAEQPPPAAAVPEKPADQPPPAAAVPEKAAEPPPVAAVPAAEDTPDKPAEEAPAATEEAPPGPAQAPPDVAAPPADAEKTASGLASKVLKAGTGSKKPAPTDKVVVHYTGWTTDGKMFDSSVVRGEPASFPLNRVIAGWTEGVGLMVEGEKRRLWIPQELAYKGRPGAPAGMLVFDVELISILEAPKAPPDVAAPPADAEKTASGLATKVLRPGTGTAKPAPTDSVKVHYSGWTTDGEMFDSSVARGEPITFPLNGVIAGWTEGVGLMVEGEKRRLWIPQDLAYKGQPGAPAGMLVFDVELLKINP